MKYYPVRIKSPHICEKCRNLMKKAERCFYYYVYWKGVTKKAYCHKGCK